MSNDTPKYDRAQIRKLLEEAFTDTVLRRFCADRPFLQPVVKEFSANHGLAELVDRVLVYCDTHDLHERLLDEVGQVYEDQYARFEPYLLITEMEKPRDRKPPEPTPCKVVTIDTPPISLELVRVAAGRFQMGSDEADEFRDDDELPPHSVDVPEFYIGRYPVTNMQYLYFTRETPDYPVPDHWEDGMFPRDTGDHPVTRVSWEDALAFCRWMCDKTKKTFRLPTEAEWEKAARGIDGRLYPWGPKWDADKCNNGEIGEGTTTPVGKYSPDGDSPYCCADMLGNVWEWCQSLYEHYLNPANEREDLNTEGERVLRGGPCRDNVRTRIRCADRSKSHQTSKNAFFGFRVVMVPDPSEP
jgi:formylglycine-generating enzyme required for sulfatase activity